MVEYDKNVLSELNRWFDEQLKSDFPIDQIKKSLLNNGYDASFVDTFIAEKTGEIPAVPEQQITNDFPETQKSPQTPVSDTPDKNNPWQNNAPTNEPTANLTEEQKSEKFKNYSYFDKVKLIITKPKVFFDEMPTTGGYKGPVLFAATNYFIGSVLSTLFCLLLNPTQITYLSSLTTATGINPYILIVLMIPLLLIIYVVLGIFLGGTILNMFFRLFKGHGTREGTIRVISYISAIMLLTWIPYIGGLIGLYGLYIALKGYSRIHKISEWRVFFALLAPLILISIIIALMGMSFIWMIAGNQNDVQEQIQQDITQLDTKMSAQFSIESVYSDDGKISIVLRNTGRYNYAELSDFKIYLNDVEIPNPTPPGIEFGVDSTNTIKLNKDWSTIETGIKHNIKVISPQSIQANFICGASSIPNGYC